MKKSIYKNRSDAFYGMYHHIFGNAPVSESYRIPLWENSVNGQYKHYPFSGRNYPDGIMDIYYDSMSHGESGYFAVTSEDGTKTVFAFGPENDLYERDNTSFHKWDEVVDFR